MISLYQNFKPLNQNFKVHCSYENDQQMHKHVTCTVQISAMA